MKNRASLSLSCVCLGLVLRITIDAWASPAGLVTGTRTGEMVAVNLDTNEVTHRIAVGEGPRALVIQGSSAFVAAN